MVNLHGMNTKARALINYAAEIDQIYRTGVATEHSYRGALHKLLEGITAGLFITNEPKQIECGAPDYIITRDNIPLGYIEAKDIAVGIFNKANTEQFERYKKSLSNLIITDYLTFQLFADGDLIVSVTIAAENGGGITADKKQFDAFLALLDQFTNYSGKTIFKAAELAGMMAAKARLLSSAIYFALQDKHDVNDSLQGQLEGFRKILINNLGELDFADMYAQTLAYGLFAARLNQRDGAASQRQKFSRVVAAQHIPQSNPFLRKFFHYIAGFELDSRIRWIVDAFADLFNAVSIDDIRKEFAQAGQDPFVHFYETFLAEYDPALRENRGVYYTPFPAVRFIVRAVDDILQKDFGLANGLADNSKIKPAAEPAKNEKEEYHKVQILDPATGTGTFLAEVVKKIHSRFASQQGMWGVYCEEHLIPRLNGFEILMASYAMAHFKLEMAFAETGFHWNGGQDEKNGRFNIFLTNTLEEAPDSVPELFMARWLANEASEARRIKRDVPVMVVMGNPPYNVSTQNKNRWIDALIGDYKKEQGTGERLKEQKLNLNDDYVKFVRYGQMLVDRNETGVLAYINNHSFLDNPTFRGMRFSLLQSFDKIFILDLHGNSKRKEVAPDGVKDENIFDIQIGVSINICIKTGEKPHGSLANIFYADLFGRRKTKYDFLFEQTIGSIKWDKLTPSAPFYFFVPKNFENRAEYEKGFSVKELFAVHNAGIKTDRDALFIDMDKKPLEQKIQKLLSGKLDEQFIKKYNVNDSGSYKLTGIIKNKSYDANNILPIQYRPFDYRFVYYQQGLTSRPAYSMVKHFLAGENTGFIFLRNMPAFEEWSGVFITNKPAEFGIGGSFPGNTALVAPLYIYPDENSLDKTETRRPNLNAAIVSAIAEKIGLGFTAEKTDSKNTFAPIDILDYIYAALHSQNYRAKYKGLLKIDFPRVPYPANTEQFNTLVSLGETLRKIHLLKTVTPQAELAAYPKEGNNAVDGLDRKDQRVWINQEQYFDNVPQNIWDFYIGGYKPAQKWLKDRNGRVLKFDDIQHYQKIVAALSLTAGIQRHIDAAFGGETWEFT